jgi:glyoxylase-like metal-dependent hydrolase (beta-lactamase superfamily II)
MLNGEKQKIPGYNNSISRNDYILLDDNQTVVVAAHKIHCILNEGHTSGSMCFQINDKYLFTGDILSLHNGKLGLSVKFFDLNHDITTKSISKIINLRNVEYFHFTLGHFKGQ